MKIPNQFNVMLVKDKKPLSPWKELTEREQTLEEKAKVLDIAQPGTLGIITGPVSRIFVLDVDGPEGEKSLEEKHIPKTWTVRTPRGRHFYFKWCDELNDRVTTRAGLFDKVDTRGDGGYVVFYGFEFGPTTVPLVYPPRWLIDALPRKESKQVTAGPMATLGSIREGNRNQSFASLAGGLRARGYTVDVIFELLKPKAKEVGFSENELMAVCQSIGRYDTPKIEGQGENVESFLADEEPVKWICKPFVAEQSIGIIGGLPESRKSWVMVDLAVECARGGGLWLNKFPVKGCKVLLIDQERSKSEVQRRLKAVIAGKGITSADLNQSLFVRSGTSTRIDLQPSFDALRKEMADIRPNLVLIDSLATFHTKEESNRMEIQQVMERIKQLRNEFNCSVILIHHSTKQSYQAQKEGAEPSYLDLAGNVAIPAAAEMCISIVKHSDDASFLHHTKATQGTKAAPFLVKVVDVKPDQSEIRVEGF